MDFYASERMSSEALPLARIYRDFGRLNTSFWCSGALPNEWGALPTEL